MSAVELVSVVVDGWQLECCGHPPSVGETIAWTLVLTQDEAAFGPDHRTTLDAEAIPTRAGGRAGVYPTVLRAGPVTAFWTAPFPARGPMRARGLLHEEHHSAGNIPDDMPPTWGLVHRIHVVTRTYEWAPGASQYRPVPGGISLRDVSTIPTWFARGAGMGTARRISLETGLLVGLAVHDTPTEPATDPPRRDEVTDAKAASPPVSPTPNETRWWAYTPLPGRER